MLKKGLFVSLITAFVLVLLGIKFYPQVKSVLGFEKETKETRIAKDASAVIKEEKKNDKHRFNRDLLEPKKMEVPPKELKDMTQKYPDKFEIVKKMYYSLDFIDNARGKVKWMRPNDYFEDEFAVDYLKEKNITTENHVINGIRESSENRLTIRKDTTRQLPLKNVYTKTESKEGLTFGNNIVTQTYDIDLLFDFNTWEYTSGMKFNMPVYEIKGTIPKQFSISLQGGPFTMTISKDTGALLDLKCYGLNQEVKYFVTVSELEINKGIPNPDQVFQLNLTNHQELPWEQYFPLSPGATGEKKE